MVSLVQLFFFLNHRFRTGNFHAQLLFTSDEDLAKAKKLVKGMVKRAIGFGGTCTGEHGVGIGKKEYLYEELGYGTVELMKKIKRTIDPLNLFNPGKVSIRFSFHRLLSKARVDPRRCTLIHRSRLLRGLVVTTNRTLYQGGPPVILDLGCRTMFERSTSDRCKRCTPSMQHSSVSLGGPEL